MRDENRVGGRGGVCARPVGALLRPGLLVQHPSPAISTIPSCLPQQEHSGHPKFRWTSKSTRTCMQTNTHARTCWLQAPAGAQLASRSSQQTSTCSSTAWPREGACAWWACWTWSEQGEGWAKAASYLSLRPKPRLTQG